MVIYNKYKLSSYLNLENSIDIGFNLENKSNFFKINHLFKFSKKLIRAILLLHFFIFSLSPFANYVYKNAARHFLKIESTILIISNFECYENYSIFN